MDNYEKFEKFCSALLNVNASVNMAPLGGCKPFKLEDYPEDSRPFLQAYVDRNCHESSRAMYDYAAYLCSQDSAPDAPEKPRFNMTFREMLEFDDACESAARCCPQYRGEWNCHTNIVEAEMYGDTRWGAKDLVKHWLKSKILWSYSYHRELPEEALEVFERYKLYKAQRYIYKHFQKKAASSNSPST